MDNTTPIQLRSRRQVAERLAISERTVRRLVAQGDLAPPLRIGRATRWRESDVLDYIHRLSQEAAK